MSITRFSPCSMRTCVFQREQTDKRLPKFNYGGWNAILSERQTIFYIEKLRSPSAFFMVSRISSYPLSIVIHHKNHVCQWMPNSTGFGLSKRMVDKASILWPLNRKRRQTNDFNFFDDKRRWRSPQLLGSAVWNKERNIVSREGWR